MKNIYILVFILFASFTAFPQANDNAAKPAEKIKTEKKEAADVRSKETIRQEIRKRRAQRRGEMAKAKRSVEHRVHREKKRTQSK